MGLQSRTRLSNFTLCLSLGSRVVLVVTCHPGAPLTLCRHVSGPQHTVPTLRHSCLSLTSCREETPTPPPRASSRLRALHTPALPTNPEQLTQSHSACVQLTESHFQEESATRAVNILGPQPPQPDHEQLEDLV